MCIVRLFLGVPCPGCGLLHALWAVAHLDLGGAFRFFPIWPLFLLFAVFRRRPVVVNFFLASLFLQWLIRLS